MVYRCFHFLGHRGCSGTQYFIYPYGKHNDLYAIFHPFHNQDGFLAPLPIAYIELVAVVVALSEFSHFSPNMRVAMNTDNADVVA